MKFSIVFVEIIILSLSKIVEHGVGASREDYVISLKDKHGTIIDCIDIHRQPALDHPLLNNHKIQMRPTSLPKGMKEGARIQSMAFGEWECPVGTVPFIRATKEEYLIRANAASDHLRPTSNFSYITHYAGLTTPPKDSSQKFYGAKVCISVYNLTNIVSPQISEAMLWLGSDIDGPYNSIEFGWTVNPQLYGDNLTRIYSIWTADGLKNTGCFNAYCPGYVQVSRTAFLGAPIVPVSIPGHQLYDIEFFLFKDTNTRNWWLVITLAPGKYEATGYWPRELFQDMSDFARVVQMGGKVSIPSNLAAKPEMGSGAFVSKDISRTCYASNIEFVNSDNQFYPPKDVPMQVVTDEPQVYTAEYIVNTSGKSGYAVLFGGPDIRK